MQLGSSLFGVCGIEIKPQLENLLGLPTDSLLKEIQLTLDLIELFVEYQVPPNMVSLDGNDQEIDTKEMVRNVKGRVELMMEASLSSKRTQLEGIQTRANAALQKEKSGIGQSSASSQKEAEIFTRTDGKLVRRFKGKYEIIIRADGKKVRRVAREYVASPGSVESESSKVAAARKLGGSQLGDTYIRADGKKIRRIRKSAPANNVSEIWLRPGGTKVPAKERANAGKGGSNEARKASGSCQLNNQKQQEGGNSNPCDGGFSRDASPSAFVDLAIIPHLLDSAFDKYDKDCAIRSATIKTGDIWRRRRQENLLTRLLEAHLQTDDVKVETNKAFDLLDAISHSGSLDISSSVLHVIIAATHRFEKDVMGSIIEDNINPIEKLERSTLIFASTVHGIPCKNVVPNTRDKSERLAANMPEMIEL